MPVPLWLAAAGQMVLPPAINAIGGWLGAGQQSDANIHMAKRQFRWQRNLINEQNEYNSPANQMKRYKEAGLNPNLMYGQGSPGNWSSTPSAPNLQAGDYQSALMGLGTQFQQARLMATQADLLEQKVKESGVKQDLMTSQKAVLDANPYLNASYVQAIVSQAEMAASMKKVDLEYQPVEKQMALSKVKAEVDRISQQFNLGLVDAKIKAEILESKEFQNRMNDVIEKWISDGSIDGDSVRFGIMMLLQKLK